MPEVVAVVNLGPEIAAYCGYCCTAQPFVPPTGFYKRKLALSSGEDCFLFQNAFSLSVQRLSDGTSTLKAYIVRSLLSPHYLCTDYFVLCG